METMNSAASTAATTVNLLQPTIANPSSTANVRSNATTSNDSEYDHITWADLDVNEEGVATGVKGLIFAAMNARSIRTIASRLNVKGLKNSKKAVMVEAIVQAHKNRTLYGVSGTGVNGNGSTATGAPKKQVHCTFRLLNVLFSDFFAAEFAWIGNTASRSQLDGGKAGNDEHFWLKVQAAFISDENQEYDKFQFTDDDVFVENDHIDPGKIVPHSWQKLRTIWKSVNAQYKAALTSFTLSGTHDSNFYSFCNGRLDTYYLRKHLEVRPDLSGMVEASLPDDCIVSSDDPLSSGSSVTNSVMNKKRKKDPQLEIAAAIREFTNSQMGTEINKHKLQIMQKEVVWNEMESNREELRSKLDEFNTHVDTILKLRNHLRNPDLPEDERADIQDDIHGLTKRKNELAKILG